MKQELRFIQIMLFAVCFIALPAKLAGAQDSSPLWKLRTQELLKERIDIDFQGVSLPDAIAFFREKLSVNIVVDADQSVLDNALISLTLNDVTAESALRWTLKAAGLQYAIADGIIYVGSPSKIASIEPKRFRRYDVGDLVVPPRRTAASDDTADDNGRTTTSIQSDRELLMLIVEFTGRENWDTAGTTRDSSAQNDEKETY